MTEILNITVPAFVLLAGGFAAVKTAYFKERHIDGIATYVFNIATPALLFNALANLDLNRLFNPGMLTGYFVCAALNYLLVYLFMHRVMKIPSKDGVAHSVGGTFSNSVLIGIPLILNFMGAERAAPLFVLIALHAPILLTLAALGMSLAEGTGEAGGVRKKITGIVKDLAKNPIIIALSLGFVWNLASLPYGGWPKELLENIAKTVGPTALFAVGATLTRYRIQGSLGAIFCLTVFKLAVFPALVALTFFKLFPIPTDMAVIGVIVAALPAGVNSYLVASHYQAGLAVNSGNILLSTIASTATLPAILFFLQKLL